jgi:polyhydroxyalkanoate synthesis regulator phasin
MKKEAAMFDFFERGFLATVGALSLSREKVQEIVDQMVARGELNLDEGKQLVDKMVKRGQEERETMRGLVRQEVQKVVGELDMASRKDFQVLNDKLDALLKKLDQS